MVKVLLLPLSLLLWLGGCTMEEAVQEPLAQRFVWFAYLNGDDIRTDCVPGRPWRYRLVYNARYKEQLRRYELLSDGAGGGILVARAQGSGRTGTVFLSDPLRDFRWQRSEVRLDAEEVAAFETALASSGFYDPPPVGMTLSSAGFYWVVVSCRDGAVGFNAWRLPAPEGTEPTFPDFLFQRDFTGVPVNPSRDIDASLLILERSNPEIDRGEGARFLLRVGERGLKGF